MNKISIIVPAFNAEKTISKCLNSLIKQTIKDIEIIVINDGSKDQTKKIVERYVKKYKNIHLYTTKNQGVYKARELGISKSDGEYIAFVDSDDSIDKKFCEIMYSKAKINNADITICGFFRIIEKTNKIISTELSNMDKNFILKNNPYIVAIINTSLWNKIFKKELLLKRLNINTIPRISEDCLFLYSLYPSVNKISFISMPLYNYYVRAMSAMQTFKVDDIEKIEKGLLELKKYYINAKNFNYLLELMIFFNYCFVLSCNIDKNYLKIYKRTKKFIEVNFPNWKKIKIKNLPNLKLKILYLGYRLGLGKFIISLYRFINNKLKISLKW